MRWEGEFTPAYHAVLAELHGILVELEVRDVDPRAPTTVNAYRKRPSCCP